jgi:mRNA interferase HicA
LHRGVDPGRSTLYFVNNIACALEVKSSEFKRWLAAQGATFESAKGSHLKVLLHGKVSYQPMHSKELKTAWSQASKSSLESNRRFYVALSGTL